MGDEKLIDIMTLIINGGTPEDVSDMLDEICMNSVTFLAHVCMMQQRDIKELQQHVKVLRRVVEII